MAPLPATRDGRNFSRALAIAFDMPFSEARDVELEYRRFLYLATLTDAPRVPPESVRLAWQMHAQSPEYAVFCSDVLGKALPLDDTSRLLGATGAYRRTRIDYAREFTARPPRLYWPEIITPRLPRWLTAHAVILGFTGMVAYGQGNPLILAIGVGISLVLYGVDLYSAHFGNQRHAFGDSLSEDLTHFLNERPGA